MAEDKFLDLRGYPADRAYVMEVARSVMQFALNSAHPVGSYYISESNVTPEELFGGKWQKIEGRFILGSDENHPVGQERGSETHIITTEELPEHKHGRGTMNITGKFTVQTKTRVNSERVPDEYTGAFYVDESKTHGFETKAFFQNGPFVPMRSVDFDASKTWTGCTSNEGSSRPMNIMPPFISANIWKRVA